MLAPLSPLLLAAQEAGLTLSTLLPRRAVPWEMPSQSRSLLLLASSGARFFSLFRETQADPSEADPLDAYTVRLVERLIALAPPGVVGGAFYPFRPPFLPFRALLAAAHWGAISPLGILVHPTRGPWFALRAALALSLHAPEPSEPEEAPCLRCPAPCVAACPGGAVHASGFLVEACGQARRELSACEDRCGAREACPVGVEWKYSREAISYHHRAASRFF